MSSTTLSAMNRSPCSIGARLLGMLAFACMQTVLASPERLASTAQPGTIPAVQLDSARSLDDIIPELARHRVVFVGEVHTRYDHHLIQLHIIQALHQRHDNLVIGVEWFQQPYQQALDRYIAGEIDEQQLLLQSEYFQRWRYDYRLYAPILRYARAQGIPVVALNVPAELIAAVSAKGIENVPDDLQRWLPRTLDRSNDRYRERLRAIYDAHPRTEFGDFERFHTVQLLWDESMAERAADYLEQHPRSSMVILAGSGHLAYGDGIPARLKRQSEVDAAIVLSQWEAGMDPGLADYLLLSPPRSLPPAGMLGVTIESTDSGGVRLREVSEGSAAALAGAEQGDRLVAIDGTPVNGIADVRTAMWEKSPGDRVLMTVQRDTTDNGGDLRKFRVTLQ